MNGVYEEVIEWGVNVVVDIFLVREGIFNRCYVLVEASLLNLRGGYRDRLYWSVKSHAE